MLTSLAIIPGMAGWSELLLILVGLCFVTVWGAGELGQELFGKPIDPLLAFLFGL